MIIRSKISTEVLHVVFRKEDFKNGRVDILNPDNFLQCSALSLKEGKTFRPHKHNFRNRTLDMVAQESFVVISGSVMCVFYDIDDKILETVRLNPGDASFTLKGGHTYRILEDSLIYEMKTGPYEGQQIDKTFI
jgi:cupin fold WbuC family metalloprotein